MRTKACTGVYLVSLYKHRPGHSRTASHGCRNHTDSHTRTHSRTCSPQRSPALRGVLPLRSFLSRSSPLCRAQSRKEPFIPVDPFWLHTPISTRLLAASECVGRGNSSGKGSPTVRARQRRILENPRDSRKVKGAATANAGTADKGYTLATLTSTQRCSVSRQVTQSLRQLLRIDKEWQLFITATN
jgi:hypothetical protein